MNVFFLRHGNTFESNEPPRQVGCHTDIPLTNKGKQQIEDIRASFLKNSINFDKIICGPLLRHKQSAKIFGDDIEIRGELTEIDYGKWENLTSEEISKNWPEELSAWNHSATWPTHIFNGSHEQHTSNLKKLLSELTTSSKYNESNILLITSQGTIRYLLKITNLWETVSNKSAMQEYKVKTGNFCILERKNQKWGILGWDLDSTSNLSLVNQ